MGRRGNPRGHKPCGRESPMADLLPPLNQGPASLKRLAGIVLRLLLKGIYAVRRHALQIEVSLRAMGSHDAEIGAGAQHRLCESTAGGEVIGDVASAQRSKPVAQRGTIAVERREYRASGRRHLMNRDAAVPSHNRLPGRAETARLAEFLLGGESQAGAQVRNRAAYAPARCCFT
jgi:hypothetical protein